MKKVATRFGVPMPNRHEPRPTRAFSLDECTALLGELPSSSPLPTGAMQDAEDCGVEFLAEKRTPVEVLTIYAQQTSARGWTQGVRVRALAGAAWKPGGAV